MTHFAPRSIVRRSIWLALIGLSCQFCGPASHGQETSRYSDEVLAKAETILREHGLRRVGSQIQAASQGDFSRLIAEETRLRRSLRQSRQRWEEIQAGLQQLERNFIQLEQQLGVWNARYAAVGNAGGRNNELVARINAGSAQLKQLKRTIDQAKTQAEKRRGELGDEEEAYAEHVLKMRRQLEAMRQTLSDAAEVRDVAIAHRVLATRYETPEELEVGKVLEPLERRLRKLEANVFSETIPLERVGGGLGIRVVVGLEPVEMILDSGASLVLLPHEVAEQAGAEPDEDARPLTLVTADGRRIEAQQVIVPRMRIGKFEAENVKAALLDRSVQIGRPLLGMSFLERFRFEIDAAKQELRLLRVDTGDE